MNLPRSALSSVRGGTARVPFTATSGPGHLADGGVYRAWPISAEVPLVLFDVQRGGPSTGMPTRDRSSRISLHAPTRPTVIPNRCCCFRRIPKECFDLSVEAFDLAERLQTPVIVMSDLDIGMNEWVTKPLEWNDARKFMTGARSWMAEMLDKVAEFRKRYWDVDGDGIPYRTLPGTHPTKGAFFTRGSSHDAFASYTEDGDDQRGESGPFDAQICDGRTDRAKAGHPQDAAGPASWGSSISARPNPPCAKQCELLGREGYKLNTMRLRAFPFGKQVTRFAEQHERIFVVEQNRDAQMRSLLMTEAGIPGEKAGFRPEL